MKMLLVIFGRTFGPVLSFCPWVRIPLNSLFVFDFLGLRATEDVSVTLLWKVFLVVGWVMSTISMESTIRFVSREWWERLSKML